MKRQIISISLLIILILIPIISWLFWYTKPDQVLNVAILDKTVLNKEEYNKIKFNNTPESLKEFLALFGIDSLRVAKRIIEINPKNDENKN